jgi:small GTP-binding protein
MIKPGADWEKEIDQELEKADIVVCLVSPDFLASDYCYEREMKRALALHDEEKLIVIPVILRHSSWHLSPLAALQALPANSQPVASWPDHDAAWLDVAKAIENICRQPARRATKRPTSQPRERTFAVAVLGMTGVGKSTLCNAVAGEEVVRVSDVIAVTKTVQRFAWRFNNVSFEVLDCPGLGEDYSSDEEYGKLYEEILQEVDFALWVQDCSSRILSETKRYVHGALRRFVMKQNRFLLLANRVDLVPPWEDWNQESNAPGRSQQVYIERRLTHWAGALGLPTSAMLAMSASKRFNIDVLKQHLLEAAVR